MTSLIYPSSWPCQIIVGTDGHGKYLEMIRVAKHFWLPEICIILVGR